MADDFLDPKVEYVARMIHLRVKDYVGKCGIVGTKNDPQLTGDPTRVTCPRCKGRR